MSGNPNTNNIITGVAGDQILAIANATWVGTFAGRIEFTGAGFDHWLFYAKGGGGWVEYNATVWDLANGLSASTSSSQGGWMAGAGIEVAIAPNWTAKIDYQYQYLGLNGFSVAPTFSTDRFMVNNSSVQIVTLGVNYLLR